LIQQGLLTKTDHKTAIKKFIKAAIKGVVKTMAKMGISTIQSYHGAQIFEAIGLNSDVVDKYFTWTPSRIQGVGLDVIAEEALARHRHAFPDRQVNGVLDAGGQYQWRDGGEFHLFNPQSIHKLQNACRTGSYKIFRNTPRSSTTRRRIFARCAACWISSSRKSRFRLKKSNRSRKS
jgi:glutamate synthase domain-containing protein 2